MAYGDAIGKPYTAGGAPTDTLATRDLGRTAIGGLTPGVQEVTHEVTGHGTLIKQVATAGTRIRLNASSLLVRKLIIQALPTNLNTVVVGDSNVVAAVGTQGTPTRRGIALNNPGIDSVSFEFNDLTNVWIDALQSSDGVTCWYWT